MLVRELRSLAENEFADQAFEWEGELPWENVQKLAEHGYLGINFPEEYGGGGMTEFEALLMNEVVGRVCPDTARLMVNQQMVAPRAIAEFGTEAAKEKYLPPVLDGEECIAIAMSEPEAGSDVRAMNTEVTEDGGDLYISGEKTWVSFVDEAMAAVVWTYIDDELGTVIIDLDDPGVEIANHFTNMVEHHQTQFYMNDVPVPEENVLVRGKEAFHSQLEALNWERLSTASQTNAISLCALDKALDYADQREQFDQPIGDFQGIEWKFADMYKKLESSRALTYLAGKRALEQDDTPDPLLTSAANLFSGEIAQDIVTESLQIHGANGYQKGHPLEYLYRFARSYQLGGGTDEIMKNTIARMLKKRGVPTLDA
jgi:alkylation response protein AidB-like acyl-CoA dehydrogenase